MVVGKNCNVDVVLSKKFHDKVNWLIENFPLEIGGYMIGEWSETGVYVEDVIFFEQSVSKSNVTKEGMADMKLVNEFGVEITNKIIGEWHSHNTMTTFWSATDESFIKGFLTNEDGQVIKNSIISIVSAYRGAMKDPYNHLVRVDIKGMMGMSATFDNLGYSVEIDDDDDERNVKLKAVKDKIMNDTQALIVPLSEQKDVIMKEAEEKILPITEQKDVIMKEAQAKLLKLGDMEKSINEEKEKEISDFLTEVIDTKLQKTNVVICSEPVGIEVLNKNTKEFQTHLSNMGKLRNSGLEKKLSKQVQAERSKISSEFMKLKKNSSIKILHLEPDWADIIDNSLSEEVGFEDILIERETGEDGLEELLISKFFGASMYRRIVNLCIDDLIKLSKMMFQDDEEEDFSEDIDDVNKQLEKDMIASYSSMPTQYDVERFNDGCYSGCDNGYDRRGNLEEMMG